LEQPDKPEVRVGGPDPEEKTRLEIAQFFTSLGNGRKEDRTKTRVSPEKKNIDPKQKGKSYNHNNP
jgi:hypothetical protein